MCFFKKKKKEIINTKFNVGDAVRFRYRGELTFGWIYQIHAKKDTETLYDVQIGGQCPAILYNINEEELALRK